MAKIALVVRTMVTGKIFQIEFSAVASLQVVLIWDSESNLVKAVTETSGDFVYENLFVTVRQQKPGDCLPIEVAWKDASQCYSPLLARVQIVQ